MKKINTPLDEKTIAGLKAGEKILLSGTIYTARDQAHKRICEFINEGKVLPVELKGQVIYYCGPTPAPENMVIGSCGPTTSSRMDEFAPFLIEIGLKGMIGKGRRNDNVIESIKKNKAVYFVAPAGAGAYIQNKVEKCSVVGFEDLGPEAIHELVVKDFPLIVAIDSNGSYIY